MFNSKEAADKLGCSLTWVRKLVKRGDLPAYLFEQGQLTPVRPEVSLQGKDVYFLKEDLARYQPRAPGRPRGAHDIVGKNPKRQRTR
jgi:excisionase family DNA binding protein